MLVGARLGPSLLKTFPMCFSTAPSETTSARLIAAFERPSAINPNTSCSRGVSAARAWCVLALSIAVTISGSSAVPPAATRLSASTNSETSATRSLSR